MKTTQLHRKIHKIIERKNHQQHLVNVLPIITFFFAVQCLLLRYFLPPEVSIGNYAMILGLALCLMIFIVNIYDTRYLNVIYQDHLWLFFAPLGINEKIYFKDIEAINVHDDTEPFGAVILHLRDGSKKSLYFVDHAGDIKLTIEGLQKEQRIQQAA